jgi:hypothetical protein
MKARYLKILFKGGESCSLKEKGVKLSVRFGLTEILPAGTRFIPAGKKVFLNFNKEVFLSNGALCNL